MSRMPSQQQRPGYSSSRSQPNGHYEPGRHSRERDIDGSHERSNGGRSRDERRPGGYGGLHDPNNEVPAQAEGRRSPQRLGAFAAPTSSRSIRVSSDVHERQGFGGSSSRSRERDVDRERLNGGTRRHGTGQGRKRIEGQHDEFCCISSISCKIADIIVFICDLAG